MSLSSAIERLHAAVPNNSCHGCDALMQLQMEIKTYASMPVDFSFYFDHLCQIRARIRDKPTFENQFAACSQGTKSRASQPFAVVVGVSTRIKCSDLSLIKSNRKKGTTGIHSSSPTTRVFLPNLCFEEHHCCPVRCGLLHSQPQYNALHYPHSSLTFSLTSSGNINCR